MKIFHKNKNCGLKGRKIIFVLFLFFVSFLIISSKVDALIKVVSTFIDMLGNDIYNVGNFNSTGQLNNTGTAYTKNIVGTDWINTTGSSNITGDIFTSDVIVSGWVNTSTSFFGKPLLINLTTDPSVPPAGQGYFYGKSISGRGMPKWKGPSGVDYPLQPSFFQNFIVMIQTVSSTTNPSSQGDSVTRVGTVSHPAATQGYGYMTNFISGAVSGNTAGISQATTTFVRGNVAGANGFFFMTRMAVVDVAVLRMFVGMTSGTLAASVGGDNPAGHHAGFQFSTARGDANWQFMTRDGTTQNLVNTGIAVTAAHVYDTFVFCSPQCTSINWRIDDVTAGTTAEGSTSNNLPGATTYLRGGLQVATIETVAKNIRMQRVYIESDR